MAEQMLDKDNVEEGSVRLLTTGEIQLAQSVFASTIDYTTVWIHKGSYLLLNLQNENTAMTPNGELYFRNQYRGDFSRSTYDFQHLFIHEMSHVWQRTRGMNVIGRGLISWLVSYRYTLDGRLLSEYPMEQQGQIIADNFTLQTQGYFGWQRLRSWEIVTLDGDTSESIIREMYQKSLRGFPW